MITEILRSPDVEQLLVDALPAALAELGISVPVSSAVPNPRPGEFVRVIRTGGVLGDVFVIDKASVTVEAWASRESRAYEIADACRGVLHALPAREGLAVTVYRVEEFAAPANLPDPTSAQHRYTATYAVHTRRAV